MRSNGPVPRHATGGVLPDRLPSLPEAARVSFVYSPASRTSASLSPSLAASPSSGPRPPSSSATGAITAHPLLATDTPSPAARIAWQRAACYPPAHAYRTPAPASPRGLCDCSSSTRADLDLNPDFATRQARMRLRAPRERRDEDDRTAAPYGPRDPLRSHVAVGPRCRQYCRCLRPRALSSTATAGAYSAPPLNAPPTAARANSRA
ncbi:hypothetical protein B0H16DRAFT_1723481 [Mycena metata]|uniref:Uncharacterized protein n=1 Tax=Mycena metata TaxID=1033252 RepID=A0AAD7NAF4_9AGAR|nr:hypothetical protein B0H16DRAFT_1723481 [Mycena metata]